MLSPERLCQIEIATPDVERALNFYEAVFGWKRVPAEIYNYYVLEVPTTCPYGIAIIPSGSTSAQVEGPTRVLYLTCESENEVQCYLEACAKAGGKVKFGPKSVSGYGRIWQFADPDGHLWGLFIRP